jgi:hypothetical protein
MKGKELLGNSILALVDTLLSGYEHSKKYPNPVLGAERELIVENLLKKVLPKNTRFGSGVITDFTGQVTGQVDIVLECQQSISLPITNGTQRLYFADTVGAAIEVKSDLNKQRGDAFKQSHNIRKLIRTKPEKGSLKKQYNGIPAFIVAFQGPKNQKTFNKWIRDIQINNGYNIPTGVLCLDPLFYYGYEPMSSASSAIEGKGEFAVYAFICTLSNWLAHNSDCTLNYLDY